MRRWVRRAAARAGLLAAVSVVWLPLPAAAQVANITVGIVAVQGSAFVSPSIASPLVNPPDPLPPGCEWGYTWSVEVRGVAGGAATVVDLGGNAFPPSGIQIELSITTCQNWWVGGQPLNVLAPPSQISGTMSGSATNGSTLSCSVTGTSFDDVVAVVTMGAQASCAVDGTPLSLDLLFSGTFLPAYGSSGASTATVAGSFTLASVP